MLLALFSDNEDQNTGVVKLEGGDFWDDPGSSQHNSGKVEKCLQMCACYDSESGTGITGCEMIWNEGNSGCYVHTKPIARGNNRERHSCYVIEEFPHEVALDTWCGGHAATDCGNCPWNGETWMGSHWCNGDCIWQHDECIEKSITDHTMAPTHSPTDENELSPITDGYSFLYTYEPTPYLRVGPGFANSCNSTHSVCKNDNICRGKIEISGTAFICHFYAIYKIGLFLTDVYHITFLFYSYLHMQNTAISFLSTNTKGDCKYHTDCNPFTTLEDGSIVVSNFTMVCVQNPMHALGPCTGNPQGTKDGEEYTDNWAATTGPLAREPWDRNNQQIDYCVPACKALIESERQNDLGFRNNQLTEDDYIHHCGVPEEDWNEIVLTHEPEPTSPPILESVGCCSHNYKECAEWCSATRTQCESGTACGAHNNMKWLEKGENEASCVARWGECTNNVSACCNGLTCKAKGNNYKQCLAPGDD